MNRLPFLSPRRYGGLASILLFAVSLAACPRSASANPAWLKLETNDFVAYSDASEKDTVEAAVEYAAFRQTFRSLFLAPGGHLRPTTLVLFRSRTEFEKTVAAQHERNRRVANYSIEVGGSPLEALALGSDRENALSLTFEFETIWTLRRIGYFIPVWMSQGTGEALATLEVRGGHCVVGGLDYERFGLFDNDDTQIPWDRFFDIGASSDEYTGPEATGVYHAQAWALMHWILFSDPGTRERFMSLALRLGHTPGLEAVQTTVNLPADQFRAAILKHLKSKPERQIPFDAAATRAGFKISPAPEAEVLVQTANLLASAGRIEPCNQQLDRAQQLAPDSPDVLEALARRADREKRETDALGYYRKAIERGTTHTLTYLRSAGARLDESSDAFHMDHAGTAGDNATAALVEIHRALALSPAEPAAYRLLGRALFVSRTITADQIAELDPAISLTETGEHIRLQRALLYGRIGQDAECIADLRQVMAGPRSSSSDRDDAKSHLGAAILRATVDKIRPLVKAGKYKEVYDVFSAIDQDDLTAQRAREFDRLKDSVKELEVTAHLTELYNTQHWDEFVAAAKDYLTRYPHGGMRIAIQHKLTEVEQQLQQAPSPHN